MSDWDKYQEQKAREFDIWRASGGSAAQVPDLSEQNRHVTEAIIAGAVIGRMVSPGPSRADVEAMEPDQRAAFDKDRRGGMIVALIGFAILALIVILAFIH